MKRNAKGRVKMLLSLLLAVAMVLGTLPAEAVAEQLSAIGLGAMTDVISLGNADESGVEKDLGAEPTTGDAAELGEDEKEEEVLIGAQSASLEVYNSEPAGSGTVDIQWRWNSDTWESRTDHVPSGAEVRITANPADGYVLSHFRVRRLAPGADVPVDVQGNVGTFTVPDTAQVTIMAYFEQGVAPVTKYPVGVNVVCADVLEDQCSVTVEPEEAEAGETVTVTVHKSSMVEFRPYGVDDQTPLFYVMSGQNAMNRWFDYFFDDQNNEGSPVTQATQVDDTTFTFTMPAEEVVVSANFRSVPFTLTLGEDVPDNVLSIYDAPNNATLLARNDEGLRAIEVRAGDRLRVDAMFADQPGDLKRMWYSYEQDGQTKEVELPHAVGYLNSSDSFTMPLANVTLHTEVNLDIWPVKVWGDPLYGTVTCDVQKARQGEEVTFTATPNNPSHVVHTSSEFYVGVNRTGENTFVFKMPDKRVDLQISFHEYVPSRVFYYEAHVENNKVRNELVMTFANDGLPTQSMSDGLYVLMKDMTFEEPVEITGNTKIILCDGYTLTAKKGIYIHLGATLTVYGQINNSGTIQATSDPDREDAAIGGREALSAGDFIVHGGHIVAKALNQYGAGIGGGDDEYSGFTNIVIYGGVVEASGAEKGAGIGLGDWNKGVGSITIYGGDVTANGGRAGAGIGGGDRTKGPPVTIYGGNVTANGGYSAAGIGGGGQTGKPTGYCGFCGECNIYGGTVVARGGYYAAGIGDGYWISNDQVHTESINIYGGDVTAYGGERAAGIGGSSFNGRNRHEARSIPVNILGGNVCAYGGFLAPGIGVGSPDSLDAPPSSISMGQVCVFGGNVYVCAGSRYDNDGSQKSNSIAGIGLGAGNDSVASISAFVQIKGGRVEVVNNRYKDISEGDFPAFGGCDNIDLALGDNMSVLKTDSNSNTAGEDGASDSYAQADQRIEACTNKEGHGVVIERCVHDKSGMSYAKAPLTHTRKCSLCCDSSPFTAEGHVLNTKTKKCKICGYKFNNNKVCTITFSKGAADATGSMATVQIGIGETFTVPECAFYRHGYRLAYWSSNDGNMQPGDTREPYDNLALTAVWKPGCLITFLSGDEAAEGSMDSVWLSGGETLDVSQAHCGFTSFGKNFDQWLIKVDDAAPVTQTQYRLSHGNSCVLEATKATTYELTARYRYAIRYQDPLRGMRDSYCFTLGSNAEVLEGGCWYAVQQNTSIDGSLKFAPRNGYLTGREVNIVLVDGVELRTRGIEVPQGWTLNVWGQTQGTGKLYVNGVEAQKAGIGGGGSVNFYGGVVEAEGGLLAAGIGGDYASGCGQIAVYGGKVVATGGFGAAGIGCGAGGGGGLVRILGGEVVATNQGGTLGIGGGATRTTSVVLGNVVPGGTSVDSAGYVGDVELQGGFKAADGVVGWGSQESPAKVDAASLAGSLLTSCNVAQVRLLAGEGEEKIVYAELGASYTLPACPFEVPVGKDFAGWDVSVDGSPAVRVAAGEQVVATGDVVATAAWNERDTGFTGVRLSLSGRIGVEFGAILSQDEEFESSGVEFEVCGRREWVPVSQAKLDDGKYYFTCHVSSVEMADAIHATLRYGDGRTDVVEYSVERYVAYINQNYGSFSEEVLALVRALADYGYYAQPFLSRANGWKIGADHRRMELHFAKSFDWTAAANTAADYAPACSLQNVGARASLMLRLDSGTGMAVQVAPEQGAVLDAVRGRFAGKECVAEELPNGGWAVRVDDVPAHLLGEELEVEVSAGGNDAVLHASALSYAHAVLAGDFPGDAKNAACALLAYHGAVNAYRSSC